MLYSINKLQTNHKQQGEPSKKKENNLEENLRKALKFNQFVLYYQAQLDHRNRIFGAEVLVRWSHPDEGIIPASEFISLIDDTDLICQIDDWVIQNACLMLASWSNSPHTQHLTLSVNVSSRQFAKTNFVEKLIAIVHQTGADPKNLRLEVTESLTMIDPNDTIEKMLSLKKYGIEFSMDNFGTEYCSLNILKNIPIHQLKIDRNFVKGIATNPKENNFVKAIIGMGTSLGLEIIAEGVETKEQLETLMQLGCYNYQGYLFGQVVPIKEFEIYFYNSINKIAVDKLLSVTKEIYNPSQFKIDNFSSETFWKNLSPNRVLELLQILMKEENLEKILQSIYFNETISNYFCSYFTILQDEEVALKLIQRKEMSTHLLCRIIYWGLSRYVSDGNTNFNIYFSGWTKRLTSEQSFLLIRDEPIIEKDTAFKIHLLANLDAKTWEVLFESMLIEEKGINDVLEIFRNIDPDQRNRLFFSNQTLYQYLRMILNTDLSKKDSKFLHSLDESLNKIYQWEEYSKTNRKNYMPQLDSIRPLGERNPHRIANIFLQSLKISIEDRQDFLEYLTMQSIIVDEAELELIAGFAKSYVKR